MTNRAIKQMPAFKRVYKKMQANSQQSVNNAICKIAVKPQLGQEKKGDLAGVFVYKFKMHTQECLLVYEWDNAVIVLLALGVHQNFYRDLKKQPRKHALKVC